MKWREEKLPVPLDSVAYHRKGFILFSSEDRDVRVVVPQSLSQSFRGESAIVAIGIMKVDKGPEPWIDKRALASCLGFSKRWVEQRTSEGMPSRLMGGQRRYRLSVAESWLRENGHLYDQEGA
jgi:hypothetical protein